MDDREEGEGMDMRFWRVSDTEDPRTSRWDGLLAVYTKDDAFLYRIKPEKVDFGAGDDMDFPEDCFNDVTGEELPLLGWWPWPKPTPEQLRKMERDLQKRLKRTQLLKAHNLKMLRVREWTINEARGGHWTPAANPYLVFGAAEEEERRQKEEMKEEHELQEELRTAQDKVDETGEKFRLMKLEEQKRAGKLGEEEEEELEHDWGMWDARHGGLGVKRVNEADSMALEKNVSEMIEFWNNQTKLRR
ncbi:hypothetical protein GE09DRAFT_1230021 [Coniochaeta sp. 2T2.1]|nr:hypothetical protein GE09DRAFT_1230021 [Coniochaeta sp. 2T2.1]